MRRKRLILTLAAVVLVGLFFSNWNSRHFGTDYCEAEGRRIPDREKIVRFMMHEYNGKPNWQNDLRGDPQFAQWMAHEAPDQNDETRVEKALNEYLGVYPPCIRRTNAVYHAA